MSYIELHKPQAVICENVSGLTKRIAGNPPEIEAVSAAFRGAGYTFSWCLLDTQNFGLPHRRQRCWMWAIRNDIVGGKEIATKQVHHLAGQYHNKMCFGSFASVGECAIRIGCMIISVAIASLVALRFESRDWSLVGQAC